MTRRTYEVRLHAEASRTMRVVAESARDAATIAQERSGVAYAYGITRAGWHIDQGAMTFDEAVSVALDDTLVGPWGHGDEVTFDDEADE